MSDNERIGAIQKLENAHRYSFRNRVEINKSLKCGCFFCTRIYDAAEVEDFIDDDETALCPYCGIDSVIGDASGIELTPSLLNKLKQVYF